MINIKKMLISGDCRIGYCGQYTPLFDSYGKPLKTGDLVQLSYYTNEDELESFHGVQYVCHNQFKDDGLDEKMFVMGIAKQHIAYLDGEKTTDLDKADFIETTVYQNHKEWRITKVKDWSETVDGELWGVVRTVLVD